MEHAFPPPFRWGSIESFQLVIVVALQIIATVIPLVARFRKRPEAVSCIFWGLFSVANVWFALSFPENFSTNWRHRTAATPLIMTVGLSAATLAFYAGFREVIRLWQAARLLELVKTVTATILPVVVVGVLLKPGMIIEWERPARVVCKNNLKLIGLALHNYHDILDIFPASRISDPFISWRVRLLPYVDQTPLWDAYDQERAWNAEENLPIAQRLLDVYFCPNRLRRNDKDEHDRYYTDYVMLTGNGAFSLPNQPIRKLHVTDGLSNTLAVTEASGLNIVWTEPRDAETDLQPIGINLGEGDDSESRGIASSRHPHGAHALFADGTVKMLNENIDPEVLKALTTIRGGEPVGDF